MKMTSSSPNKYEIKRKLGNGFLIFNKNNSRYFFENVSNEDIKKIYKNGFDSPIRIQWRITQKCNLNCKHCYLDEKNNKSKELSKKQIIEAAKKIVDAKVFEILITGGEPTIKEGIIEVLDILGKHCSIIIFTNALDDIALKKILPTIIKYKENISINVSLDGPVNIHESIRGIGTYKKTINNINLLINKGIEVNTNTVLTTSFIPHLEKFIEELRKIKLTSIKFSKFYPLGEGEKYKNLMPSPELFSNTSKKLLEIKKDEPRITFDNNFCFLINNRKQPIDTRKCSGGISKLVIESNGNVFPCQLLPLRKFFMGNFTKDSVKKLWNNKNRKKFIKDFFPNECKKCEHNKYCNSGCKASSFSIHKDFKEKDPYCFYEKDKKNCSI